MNTRLVSLVTTMYSFSILDPAQTKFELRLNKEVQTSFGLKEGMYIGWENAELNRKIKHVSATFAIYNLAQK